MPLSPIKQVILIAGIFTILCAIGYLSRDDYYHKQSDQFYYLSLADSLRAHGEMKALVDMAPSYPPSANTGVALLMFPFSALKWDKVALGLVLIYVLLNILSVFPLYRVLQNFGLRESQISQVLALYFISFPITMFKIWPVNEGPSLFFCSWFLYFIFVRPRWLPSLILALISPIFRVHIMLLEIALLVYGGVRKRKDILRRASASTICSAIGLAIYRFLFPFFQKGLGKELHERNLIVFLIENITAAATHLFAPESITKTLFGAQALLGASILGTLILCCVGVSYLKNIKEQRNTELQIFGVCVLTVTTVSLIFSLTIIARFYSTAYLWMLVAPVTWLGARSPKILRVGLFGLATLNGLVLLAYLATPSTDPSFQTLEDMKELSKHAREYPVLYFDENFPAHNRQIYAYYRRPSGPIGDKPVNGRFLYLSTHPQLATLKLAACQTERFDHGTVSLINADCSGLGPSQKQ